MRTPKVTFVVAALVGATACANTSSQPGPAAPSNAANDGAKPITYEGGDGLSCETRVVIRGATGSGTGVPAEYDWLKVKYPGYHMRKQALVQCAGKSADALEITSADGKDLRIYFDISDFFGKEFGLTPR
jgi:hypothetical protein